MLLVVNVIVIVYVVNILIAAPQPTTTRPQVTVMPSNQTVEVTNDVTFTTKVSGVGAEKFTYQWKCCGEVINGETRDTLMITNVNDSDAGSYECIVTNEEGDSATGVGELVVTGEFSV